MPKMTLDEAVNVLNGWDVKHKNKYYRWSVHHEAPGTVVEVFDPMCGARDFARVRPDKAILAAARWAKKEMEKKP